MSTGPDQSRLIDEQLSAWLDDELPAAEFQLLASRLERSPEHRARFARYSLIGSTLRDGQAGARSAGLLALKVAGRVSGTLDAMPVPAVPVRPALRLLPYAAAASIALIALALVPLLRPAEVAHVTTTAGLAVRPGAATLTPVRAPLLVEGRDRPAGQPSLSPRRLTSYLVYHGEYSGVLSAKLTDSHIVNNRAYAVVVHGADQPHVR